MLFLFLFTSCRKSKSIYSRIQTPFNTRQENVLGQRQSKIKNILAITSQKHGTTSKPLKAVRLDSDEQAKIAKSGLEMKMMSSEMDAETEKWQGADENNDIVKR